MPRQLPRVLLDDEGVGRILHGNRAMAGGDQFEAKNGAGLDRSSIVEGPILIMDGQGNAVAIGRAFAPDEPGGLYAVQPRKVIGGGSASR